MGKISVIIPTYNRKNTILRAIESALNQSVPPYEILVCDDGSTDGTEAFVKKIKDKRIKWIPEKHTGLPAVPRNRGIKESKGEWLAFLDSDDWWLPKKMEKQMIIAQHNGLLAVGSNAFLIRQQKNYGKLLDFKNTVITFRDLLNINYIICSSAIFHRSLLKKCIGFPEDNSLKAIEDFALWLRIATQTSIGYIREPLVYYNDDILSIRTKGPQTLMKQKEKVYKNFLRWVELNDSLINYRKDVETAYGYLHP